MCDAVSRSMAVSFFALSEMKSIMTTKRSTRDLPDGPRAIKKPSILSVVHYVLLASGLLLYVYFACFRMLSYNIISEATASEYANGCTYVMVKGVIDSSRGPLSFNHLVFNNHNPALYRIVCGALLSAGLDEYGVQVSALVLTTLTLLLVYFFVRSLFHHKWIALVSTLYLAFSAVFYGNSSSLFGDTYGAFFGFAALLFYLLFLRAGRRTLMATAMLCYFLACWNYWAWWIVPGIMFIGIHHVERRRLFSPSLALLFVAPLLTLCSLLCVLAVQKGGVFAGLKWFASVAAWRILDHPMPEGYGAWHDAGQFLNLGSLGAYLQMTGDRIEEWYYLGPAIWAGMLAIVLLVHPRVRTNSYTIFLYLLPASFCWSVIFVQHAIIHSVVTAYHFPFFGVLFGCFVVETPSFIYRKLHGRRFRKLIACSAIFPVVYPVASGMLLTVLSAHQEHKENFERVSAVTGALERPSERGADKGRRVLVRQAEEMLGELFFWPDEKADIQARIEALKSQMPSLGAPLASSVWESGFEADKAFDDDSSTCWVCAYGAIPAWLECDVGSRMLIREYSLYLRGSGVQNPGSWTFQGYDGSSWIDLHSVSGHTTSADGYYDFAFDNESSYQRYRWYITSSEDSGQFVRLYSTRLYRGLGAEPGQRAPTP